MGSTYHNYYCEWSFKKEPKRTAASQMEVWEINSAHAENFKQTKTVVYFVVNN